MGTVTSTLTGAPRLYRRARRKIFGGVAGWIVLQTPPGSPRRTRFDWLGYVVGAVVVVAGVLTLAQAAPLGRLFIPSALAVFGGALIWRQASEPQRERWWQLSRTSLGSAGRRGLTRLALGAALVISG